MRIDHIHSFIHFRNGETFFLKMNVNENVIHRNTANMAIQTYDSMNTVIFEVVSTLISSIELSVKNAIVSQKVEKNGQYATRGERDRLYEFWKIKKKIHHSENDDDEDDEKKNHSSVSAT